MDSDEPENDPLTDSRQHEQLHVNRMIGKALTFEEAIRLVPYPVKQPEISDVPFEVLGTVAFVRDMGPHLVLELIYGNHETQESLVITMHDAKVEQIAHFSPSIEIQLPNGTNAT